MKVPCKNVVQAGLRPVPTLWLDQPPVGDVQKTDSLKRRASARALSLGSLDSLEHGLTLLNCGTPRSYASRFRNCALQRAGPLDAHLGTNHQKKSKTVPKP